MNQPLRLVRIPLAPRELARFCARRFQAHQRAAGGPDYGYVAHSILTETFGPGAIKPFRILAENGHAARPEVLGYTTRTRAELEEAAQLAAPDVEETLRLSELAVKDLPQAWRTGRILRFELLTSPTVRLASARTLESGGETRSLKAGSDIDAWLHAAYLAPDPNENVSRSEAYITWLQRALGDSVELRGCDVQAFRRERFARRGAKRTVISVERPWVLFDGAIEIIEPDAFNALLRRGVGRQRAFGLGMLLLRPG